MRSTWDKTWMDVAVSVSRRSACIGRQVGAVIVTAENRPVAVGYNGPPANMQRVIDSNCTGYCPRANGERGASYDNCVSVHAEANAFLFADRDAFKGGTIYVTNPCCWNCAKLVANSGVARVVVRRGLADSHADVDGPIKFIEQCGIVVKVIADESL